MRDQVNDSEEVVTPLMLDGTYLSRNFATLGPLPDSRRVLLLFFLMSGGACIFTFLQSFLSINLEVARELFLSYYPVAH